MFSPSACPPLALNVDLFHC